MLRYLVMKKTDAVKRELARSMLDAGKTYREVAEALNIGLGTVHSIAAERPDARLAGALRKNFSSRCLMMADQILSDISRHDIAKSSLQQQTIAMAILLDKAMLLEKASDSAPCASEHPNKPDG